MQNPMCVVMVDNGGGESADPVCGWDCAHELSSDPDFTSGVRTVGIAFRPVTVQTCTNCDTPM